MSEHGTYSKYQADCRCDECRAAAAAYQRKKVAQRKNSPKPDHIHGTTNGYSNYGCRCSDCRRAWAAELKRRKAVRIAGPVPEHVHGTVGGFDNYKCRCEACREAKREYERDYYARKQSREARGLPSRSEVCRNGHRLEGEHLYVRRDGRKMCRTCGRERHRQWRAARQATA